MTFDLVNSVLLCNQHMNIVELYTTKPSNPFAPKEDIIYICEDNISSLLDLDFLKDVILRKEKEIKELYPHSSDGGTGLGDSLTSRFKYFNLLLWEETLFLQKIIKDKHNEFLNKLGYPNNKKIYCACWANVVRKGQRIKKHQHFTSSDAYLGGHICVNVKDTHTYYVEPYYHFQYESPNENGKLTLFPNWIEHGTSNLKHDMERITIAFDLIYEDGFENIYPQEKHRWVSLD